MSLVLPGVRTLFLLLAGLTAIVSSAGECTIQELNDILEICGKPGLNNYEIQCRTRTGSNPSISVYAGNINLISEELKEDCAETLRNQCTGLYIKDRSNGKSLFKQCTVTTSSILSDEPTTANSTSANDKAANVTDRTNGIVVGIVVGVAVGIAVVIVVGYIVFLLYKCYKTTQTRSRDPEAPQVRQVYPGRTQNNIGMEARDDRPENLNLTEEASSENRNGMNRHGGSERSAFLPPKRHGRTQNNIELEARDNRSEDVNPAEEASSKLMEDQSD